MTLIDGLTADEAAHVRTLHPGANAEQVGRMVCEPELAALECLTELAWRLRHDNRLRSRLDRAFPTLTDALGLALASRGYDTASQAAATGIIDARIEARRQERARKFTVSEVHAGAVTNMIKAVCAYSRIDFARVERVVSRLVGSLDEVNALLELLPLREGQSICLYYGLLDGHGPELYAPVAAEMGISPQQVGRQVVRAKSRIGNYLYDQIRL